MIYFFAGADNSSSLALLKEEGVNNVLLSYFNFSKKNVTDYKEFNAFLDSGAFSAFYNNKPISIEDYIAFLTLRKDNFKIYANLDDIKVPEITLQNQTIMEEAGLNPLPCFHYGEDFKFLKHYADNYDYFAIGGLVPYAKDFKRLTNFLDKVFFFLGPYIQSKKLKLHGFGMGAPRILTKYPFYSADSTSWLSGGTFGTMVSWDTQKLNFVSTFHYSERDKMLNSNVNVKTLDSYIERQRHNIKQYQAMERDITDLWQKRGISWDK